MGGGRLQAVGQLATRLVLTMAMPASPPPTPHPGAHERQDFDLGRLGALRRQIDAMLVPQNAAQGRLPPDEFAGFWHAARRTAECTFLAEVLFRKVRRRQCAPVTPTPAHWARAPSPAASGVRKDGSGANQTAGLLSTSAGVTLWLPCPVPRAPRWVSHGLRLCSTEWVRQRRRAASLVGAEAVLRHPLISSA